MAASLDLPVEHANASAASAVSVVFMARDYSTNCNRVTSVSSFGRVSPPDAAPNTW